MSEKPQKRLVSKEEYVMKLLEKGSSHAFAIIVIGSGCALLLSSLRLMWFVVEVKMDSSLGDATGTTPIIAVCGLLSVLSMGAIRYGIKRFKATEKMESVALVTRHNTGFLPEVETLVRCSDLPPMHQQAELLRAPQYGKETPAEELLKASDKTGQDA
jgi:hypothetical protein